MAKASTAKASTAKASTQDASVEDVKPTVGPSTDEVDTEAKKVEDEVDEEIESLVVEYINPEVGLTTREFSKVIHGKKFQALAKMFAEKFNGTIL